MDSYNYNEIKRIVKQDFDKYKSKNHIYNTTISGLIGRILEDVTDEIEEIMLYHILLKKRWIYVV